MNVRKLDLFFSIKSKNNKTDNNNKFLADLLAKHVRNKNWYNYINRSFKSKIADNIGLLHAILTVNRIKYCRKYCIYKKFIATFCHCNLLVQFIALAMCSPQLFSHNISYTNFKSGYFSPFVKLLYFLIKLTLIE